MGCDYVPLRLDWQCHMLVRTGLALAKVTSAVNPQWMLGVSQ